MEQLKNGCARSPITVTPSNWNTAKASIKKNWKITYRYYDPAFKNDPELWGKQFPVRGMNRFKSLEQRQDATRTLLEGLLDQLDNRLFNPITGKYPELSDEDIQEISPSTLFIPALRSAKDLLTAGVDMMKDVGYCINALERAASKLYDNSFQKPYSALKISQVSRKHLVYILVQCAKDNPRLSAYSHNRYRSYLIMLFKELVRVEAAPVNPANDIAMNHNWVKKKREVLDDAEALIVDTNLKAWDYPFWRYTRIFYRSGSRTTELFGLKTEKVDIMKQEFTLLVKKGKQYKEQTRPIPNDILPLWIEVLSEAEPGDFLFSTKFRPGKIQQRKDLVCYKWKKYVMNDPGKKDPHNLGWGLGIKKNFYPLKHKNLDKIAEQRGLALAKASAGHTSEATTRIYTVDEEKRKIEELKHIEVKFI